MRVVIYAVLEISKTLHIAEITLKAKIPILRPTYAFTLDTHYSRHTPMKDSNYIKMQIGGV